MVKKLVTTLRTDYPEVSELNHLLTIARYTWLNWGISAPQLSSIKQEDPYLFDLLDIMTE